jgi:hypothetical protein
MLKVSQVSVSSNALALFSSFELGTHITNYSYTIQQTYLGDLALRSELHLGLDRRDNIAFDHCSLVPDGWSKISNRCQKAVSFPSTTTHENRPTESSEYLRVVGDDGVGFISALVRSNSEVAVKVLEAAHRESCSLSLKMVYVCSRVMRCDR